MHNFELLFLEGRGSVPDCPTTRVVSHRGTFNIYQTFPPWDSRGTLLKEKTRSRVAASLVLGICAFGGNYLLPLSKLCFDYVDSESYFFFGRITELPAK